MTVGDRDVQVVHRFYLQIDGVNLAVFLEISGLQVETEVFEYEEGGNNGFVHKLPGQTRVGNLTCRRGVATSNELFTWYMQVAGGQIERRNLSVIIYTYAGEEMRRWNFFSAYPVRWVGPTLDANTTDYAIESIELAHAGMQLG
ncbi:MAG: phage tail protein [Candidatus Viridilinea halotolerans]|uniref:Phage tail protein n=1 Tax=Candidatus Viridilinea halotolerans TaxID=2491704 RepID=A0A426U1U8_9CHLR|nr:MAG: phage tail protein [Candidatus Viridilinea halotolerans]